MRDTDDMYQNSNDAVMFGSTIQFFVQKGLQFEIRAQTKKLDFGL